MRIRDWSSDVCSSDLTDWDSDAYLTVSGQNSNNTVRVDDDFLRAVEDDGDWALKRRTDGKVSKVLKARELWEQIGHAAWASADQIGRAWGRESVWKTV